MSARGRAWVLTSVAAVALAAVVVAGCAPTLDDPTPFLEDGCGLEVQQGLLQRRCATDGCHVPYMPQAGVDYVSGGLAERLVGVESATCPGVPIIDPDDPDRSHLLARVSATPTCDGEPIDQMPLGGPPLSEEELRCLTRWVHALAAEAGGAPRPDAGADDGEDAGADEDEDAGDVDGGGG